MYSLFMLFCPRTIQSPRAFRDRFEGVLKPITRMVLRNSNKLETCQILPPNAYQTPDKSVRRPSPIGFQGFFVFSGVHVQVAIPRDFSSSPSRTRSAHTNADVDRITIMHAPYDKPAHHVLVTSVKACVTVFRPTPLTHRFLVPDVLDSQLATPVMFFSFSRTRISRLQFRSLLHTYLSFLSELFQSCCFLRSPHGVVRLLFVSFSSHFPHPRH
jgi:hypothetical protein